MSELELYPPTTPKPPVWKDIAASIILSAVTLFIILFVFWRVIHQPGIAPGADTSSFAHTAQYSVDYFRDNHRLPSIDLNWYAGFEEQQAPPMITIVLGIVYYFTHDIELATRILTPLGIFLFYLIMFITMKLEKYPTLNAWMAGIGYAFIPSVFLTFGSYTKFMALMFLPPAFYFTNKILTNPHKYKYTALLALMIGLSIYSHPMNGFVFSLCLIIYSVIYAFLDNNIEFKRVFNVIGGVILGFMFGSNYVLPFVLEKAGRTAVPSEESTYFYGFADIYQSTIRNFAGGFSLAFLFVFFKRHHPKIKAVFMMALFTTVICVFYLVFGLGKVFPFSLTYAYIWTELGGFFCAYLMGSIFGFPKILPFVDSALRTSLAIGTIMIFLFFVDTQPFVQFRIFGSTSLSSLPGDLELAREIQKIDNYGRVYPTHYPFGFTNWVIAMKTDKPNIEGHYFGISRIGHQISNMSDAIHNRYYDYVLRKIKILNTRYIVANEVLWNIKDPEGNYVGQEFLEELNKKSNFQNVYTTPPGLRAGMEEYGLIRGELYRLFYDEAPSNYLVPIQDKVLAIGRFGPNVAAAVSDSNISVVEANDIYLDNYDVNFLKKFDTVILYGFAYRDHDKAEQLAKNYVESGGNLVVELFGSPGSKIVENPTFLGVTPYNRKIKEDTPIDVLKPEYRNKFVDKLDIPAELIDDASGLLKRVQMKEWNTKEYGGLDEPIASFPNDANLSIFGYKNLEGGKKVTFIGGNIFYHLYITHNSKELSLVESIIQPKGINNFSDPKSSDFQSQQIQIKPEEFTFNVQNSKNQLAFISIAHSKHWKAYADNKEIKVHAIEDLVAVDLPPGNYTLKLKYGRTAIKNLSEGLTFLTLIGLIGILIYDAKKTKKRDGEK